MQHMKIGIVSDTHMPKRATRLPKVLRETLQGVDLILHAGDWVTLEAYEELRTIAPVDGIAGNNDGDEIVAKFGKHKIVQGAGRKIGLVHGHEGKGRTTEQRAWNSFQGVDVDVILFGHSHIPFFAERDGRLLFNPGSATDKRRQPQFSFGVMTIGETIEIEHVFYQDKN